MDRPGVVVNPAIVSSRLRFGLARQVQSSRPEPARSFSTLGPNLLILIVLTGLLSLSATVSKYYTTVNRHHRVVLFKEKSEHT